MAANNTGPYRRNFRSNDGDNDSVNSSHSYIDPSEWNPTALNQHDGPSNDYTYDINERPPIPMELIKELPSRNLGAATGSGTAAGNTSGKTIRPVPNANGTLRLKTANVAIRQTNVNEDELYNALSNDPDATPEEIKETLRNINQSLTLKRSVKARLSHDLDRRKKHNVSCMKRLKYRIAMTWQHTKHEFSEVFHSLDLWHSHLKTVQGHFGSGVASYFFFLRWLFYLNLFAFIILLAFVVTPQLVWRDQSYAGSNASMTYNESEAKIKFNGLELLTGTGVFETSIMYYGGYTNATIGGKYHMPEAYLFANSAYMICCMIFLSYSLAKSYRQNYIETSGDINNKFSNKVFSAWDYSIERENAARLKSRSIYNELMELIESETKDEDERTMGEKCYIYFWRAFINVVILGSMGGLGYLVYYMLDQKFLNDLKTEIKVLDEMRLALVVTIILFIVPIIFTAMSDWEAYTSKQVQLYLNMIRIVALRIVVLGVVTYFWLKKSDANRATEECWESELGQEVYRLIIVDLICVLLFSTLIMELFRRIGFDAGAKCFGNPEFNIAQNTLDLIYIQTLTWVGFFYCPLLPLITLIKLVVIFYTKRLSVVQNCRPSLKPWKGAHAQTVFLSLTLFNFILAVVSVGYSILVLNPSLECGPFRHMKTRYDVVIEFLTGIQVLEIILSPGAVSGFLLFLAVVVYYARATAKAHEEMVSLLRDQLIMEGKDKVFLLQLFETAMQHRSASITSTTGAGNKPNMNANPVRTTRTSGGVEKTIYNKNYNDYPLTTENIQNIAQNSPTALNPPYGVRYMEANVPANRKPSEASNALDPNGLIQPKQGWGKNRDNKTPEAWALDERRGSSRSNNSTPTRDGSPFSVIPEHVRSASPTGSWDRRRSQTPRRGGPVPPPLARTAHQQGFQYLSQDSPTYSPTRSRNSTPQRF